MKASLLVHRGLRHHRRMHVAVALGVMVASATLTGALLVGDSMRGSLRAQALSRLGKVDRALMAPRFFRDELAKDAPGDKSVPAILMRGGVRHAENKSQSHRVGIIGVEAPAWPVLAVTTPPPDFTGRVVALNATLAQDLQAKVGDDVLLNLANPSAVSVETLLGRRDESALSLRVNVSAIIPDAAGGGFSLSPSQVATRNAFVPLQTLQRTIKQESRANAVLFTGVNAQSQADSSRPTEITGTLTLTDYGLRLRADALRSYVSLESDAMLLQPAVESAAKAVAKELQIESTPLFTYLATGIAKSGAAEDGVPYSVVTAIDPQSPTFRALRTPGGDAIEALQTGEILLNAWTADQIAASPGDRMTLTYLMTGPFGRLDERTADFTLRAVVAMNESAADPGFAPDYPGITDAKSLADWDPPFPLDLKRIRPADDVYWESHRTAPKVFVTLDDGQRLWVDQPERFGKLTAVRFHAPVAAELGEFTAQLQTALQAHLTPEQFGFELLDVRVDALRAAQGSTDFGMLFTGFSFFLIAAAAMLTALLFRLGAEGRSAEIGLLIAAGYRPRTVSRLLLSEGLIVSVIGVTLGLLVAAAYAWLMLAGLRSWWSAAANAPFLQLFISPVTLLIGAVSTFAVAYLSLAASVRGLTRRPPRRLLSGDITSTQTARTAQGSKARYLTVGCTIIAAALLAYAALAPNTALPPIFFGVGAATLTAALAFAYRRMTAAQPRQITHSGRGAWTRLGVRNAPRHPGRSLLTLALMASAVFLVVSVGAFRIEPQAATSDRHSGYGGYTLLAESAVPLPYDLDTTQGRESLGFTPEDEAGLAYVGIDAFRLRAGDEASCLSLYQAREPRLLGATNKFIARGGFRFAASLAESDEQRANPWHLLNVPLADGAIPVIGDEAAVKWQLKSGLGQDLVIRDERGTEVRLRFVALLSGSILQSEVVMSEASLTHLFPSISGHSFFLVSAPAERLAAVEQSLETSLPRYSLDVMQTTERLASYVAVQNTYLGTFQTLGGLGLILGSAGLGVVMLRNVAERRGELALLRALGYTKRALGWMVISENALLTVGGLMCGAVPAIIAITPQLLSRPQAVPVLSLTLTLIGVLLVGLASGLIALRATLRAPMLRALRQE